MKYTILRLVADIDESVVSDTYGEDGPYTGYSEYAKSTRIHGLLVERVDDETPRFSLADDRVWTRMPVAVGDIVWLVAVYYSDGGTFASTTGHIALADIFETEREAEEVARRIRAGELYDFGHAPWKGYFARLDCVRVHGVPIVRQVGGAKA